MSKILCVGRQFGSGGHQIAKQAAERLGIPYYDKDLLEKAAEISGISKQILEKAEERAVNPLLYGLYYEGNLKEHYGKSANDIIYAVQKLLILDAASEGDCVIVGRCAGEILRETQEHFVLDVFIAAPMDFRIKRTMEIDKLEEKEAAAKVRKMDKIRKAYYNYYSERDWGKPSDYDIVVNSCYLGEERAVELMVNLFTAI